MYTFVWFIHSCFTYIHKWYLAKNNNKTFNSSVAQQGLSGQVWLSLNYNRFKIKFWSSLSVCLSVCLSSLWYNRTGWLGVKHQVSYSLSLSLSLSLPPPILPSLVPSLLSPPSPLPPHTFWLRDTFLGLATREADFVTRLILPNTLKVTTERRSQFVFIWPWTSDTQSLTLSLRAEDGTSLPWRNWDGGVATQTFCVPGTLSWISVPGCLFPSTAWHGHLHQTRPLTQTAAV